MKHLVGHAFILAAFVGLQASASPAVVDFRGTWKVSRFIGESQGGVTAQDPKTVVGKQILWTATGLQSPEKACRFKNPRITSMRNRDIETTIWGGQNIQQLELTEEQIKKGFGARQTPMFRDENACADAILIGRDHMVFGMESGLIYLLDRVGR